MGIDQILLEIEKLPLEEKINVKCPEDSGEIVIRHTRRGKTFYGCKNWPVCKFASWTKPKSNNSESANVNSVKQS